MVRSCVQLLSDSVTHWTDPLFVHYPQRRFPGRFPPGRFSCHGFFRNMARYPAIQDHSLRCWRVWLNRQMPGKGAPHLSIKTCIWSDPKGACGGAHSHGQTCSCVRILCVCRATLATTKSQTTPTCHAHRKWAVGWQISALHVPLQYATPTSNQVSQAGLLQKGAAQIKQYQCPQGPAMPPGNWGCWHREMWWGQMKPRAQGYLPKHRFCPLSLHRGDSKRGCQIEGLLNSQADLQSCSLVGQFNQGAQWDTERLHERHRPTQRKGIVPVPEEDDLGRRQFISTSSHHHDSPAHLTGSLRCGQGQPATWACMSQAAAANAHRGKNPSAVAPLTRTRWHSPAWWRWPKRTEGAKLLAPRHTTAAGPSARCSMA